MAPKHTHSDKSAENLSIWLQVVLPAVVFISSCSVLFFQMDQVVETQKEHSALLFNLVERMAVQETLQEIVGDD